MPDWIGPGVVTPFPGTVVVDVEVVLVDNWVVNVDDVLPGVDVVEVLDAGGWPQFCSMQYELPTTREQALARDGFYGRGV
jgi:hypothetical protein